MIEAGLSKASVHWNNKLELPGYYRPEKCWDLIVVVDRRLLAIIEFKARWPFLRQQLQQPDGGSPRNATDLWAAYREAHSSPRNVHARLPLPSKRVAKSTAPVTVKEPHFPVFEEFKGASYAKRYEILLTKLLRERLYDGACLLLSTQDGGGRGEYREPSEELTFQKFAGSLLAHAIAFSKTHGHSSN